MIFTTSSVQSLQRLCKNMLRMGLFGIWMVLMWLTMAVKAVDQENIMSTVGQSVVLTCKAPGNMTVLAVEWYKHGLKDYVLCCRDGHLDQDGQDASFIGRVDLRDRHMQNGDLSLVLMHVMTSDSGTYECNGYQRGAKRRKRDAEVLSITKLNVMNVSLSDDDGAISDAGTENHLQLSLLVVSLSLSFWWLVL